jgi:hypothetical protein
MIRTNVWMKLLTSVLLTAVTAFAQSSDRGAFAPSHRAIPGYASAAME